MDLEDYYGLEYGIVVIRWHYFSAEAESTFSSNNNIMSSSCPDFHAECLEKLRWICAATLISHGHSYPVNKHSADLQTIFGVDAGKDISIYPEKFCNSCNSSISNFKKRGERPTTEIFQWIDSCGGKDCSIYQLMVKLRGCPVGKKKK